MTILKERSDLSATVVCGDHARAALLCQALDDAGVRADSADIIGDYDVVVFDLATCRPSLVLDLIDFHLAQGAERPLLASLGGFDDGSKIPADIDVRFSMDAALALAPMRFHFARRVMARRAEAELRQRSFSRFGVNQPLAPDREPRPVLYVGDVSRVYPALERELAQRERAMTAALSAYTAFDYLHDAPFDAIVLDAGAPAVRVDSFCDMISRSPGLTDIPLLVLMENDAPVPETVLHRASDLAPRNGDPAQIAEQLLHLSRLQAPPAQSFTPPGAGVTDPATGLFCRDFFENHLALQIDWAHRRQQPLCLIVFNVTIGDDDPALGADVAHAAKVIRSLLRAQDAPCRLDWTRIVVSLPGADRAEAAAAARRICDVMDATAFETRLDSPARQVVVSCRIASLTYGMGAPELLEEANRLSNPKRHHAA